MQVFFFSPYFSSAEKTRGTRQGGRRAPSRSSSTSWSCSREAPDAGDLPDPAPVRRALGEGEQAARVTVTSAVELDAGDRRADRRGDREADRPEGRAARAKVDETILGGLVLQVGNMVLDASVRNRLEKLRKNVAQRGVGKGAQTTRWRSSQTRSPASSGSGSRAWTPGRRPLRGRNRARDRRRHRPRPRARQLHGARDARAAPRRRRPGAEPRGGQRRRRALRRVGQGRRGRHRQAHRQAARDPGRRASCSAAWSTRSAARSTTRARSTPPRPARPSSRRPGVVQRQRRQGADADRPQGDRLDDPDRPRPARADHRRPPDRQDGDRDRHDHQQQGRRPRSASTSRSASGCRPSSR